MAPKDPDEEAKSILAALFDPVDWSASLDRWLWFCQEHAGARGVAVYGFGEGGSLRTVRVRGVVATPEEVAALWAVPRTERVATSSDLTLSLLPIPNRAHAIVGILAVSFFPRSFPEPILALIGDVMLEGRL